MPDFRKHRGPHPEDEQSFAPEAEPILNRAVGDLSWMLSRDYAMTAALKLVGDRFQLTERQRIAVMRCSCSDADRQNRLGKLVASGPSKLDCARMVQGQPIELDGFNVLTTVEAALAGGVLLLGRDGCLRDMASMHGSFRRVEETRPALECVGRVLEELGVESVLWLLDRPVSNSGRLVAMIRQTALERGWAWQAELADDVDAVLARSPGIVATADCAILNRCTSWCNLAREVVGREVPGARVLRLVGAE
ncbi:MAG: DUF434 domain-containing protein [Pirellulaceae bacterium]|nr:DUF434 domain-containing protein [Pirellulaceae bacterium]